MKTPDRYNNLNGTAPEVDPLKQSQPKVPRSDFGLSRTVYFKALDGMIIPFDVIRVLPNSQYELKYNIKAIMTNPYVRQLLTGKRAYVHVYHNNDSDMWEGADQFHKKGRDFRTELEIPHINHYIYDEGTVSSPNTYYSTFSAGAPSSYMGLPVERYDGNSSPLSNILPKYLGFSSSITSYPTKEFTDDEESPLYGCLIPDESCKISALPFVMYTQIYQGHYLNKNLINDNKKWLPDIENHFILPFEASGKPISHLSYDIDEAINNRYDISSSGFKFDDVCFCPRNPSSVTPLNDNDVPLLNVMHFRQFKPDMFTSGSPFIDLLRGDTPTMSMETLGEGTLSWDKLISSVADELSTDFDVNGELNLVAARIGIKDGNEFSIPLNWYEGEATDNPTNQLINLLTEKVKANVSGTLAFNMNALRALDVYTLLGERAARTDGTYASYIQTMFGVKPKRKDHTPTYLGGFYLDFVNSTIEQTSETGETPLGSTASRGITSGSSYIGKFSFDDFGYIMAVLDIVDETVYVNGVDREWTELDFDSQYNPLFNGLAPQFTKNLELFVQSDNNAHNQNPFNYVERFSDKKSRRNKALGQMAIPSDYDIESNNYLHVRRFEDTPNFNNNFVTMLPDNIDMTPYSSSTDYPWLFTIDCLNEAVLPLPYITEPGSLGLTA